MLVWGSQERLLPLGQAENPSWVKLEQSRFYHVSEDVISAQSLSGENAQAAKYRLKFMDACGLQNLFKSR